MKSTEEKLKEQEIKQKLKIDNEKHEWEAISKYIDSALTLTMIAKATLPMADNMPGSEQKEQPLFNSGEIAKLKVKIFKLLVNV